jgi:hypothetical protein
MDYAKVLGTADGGAIRIELTIRPTRELAATLALAGLMVKPLPKTSDFEDYAETAIAHADELLKQLKNGQSGTEPP